MYSNITLHLPKTKMKRMSRIDKLIASMPPKMANAVIHQRKLHACLMELTTNKSRDVAARAIFLNYLDGYGRD